MEYRNLKQIKGDIFSTYLYDIVSYILIYFYKYNT